jgi:alkanesulfonate monooxygenase SsuD/methylene tetrahydromethanopterin reductase-like flavin-dependent oxidoreductase (luciferase family)
VLERYLTHRGKMAETALSPSQSRFSEAERHERRALAAAEGRDIQFGISAFAITRETREAAQAEHDRLYALRHEEAIPGVDPKVVMIRTYAYARGYVGSNGGTAAGLVGTPQDIAERFQEFLDIGVTTFLLQFHPMLEEMARFGEQVVPLLTKAGVWVHPTTVSTLN